MRSMETLPFLENSISKEVKEVKTKKKSAFLFAVLLTSCVYIFAGDSNSILFDNHLAKLSRYRDTFWNTELANNKSDEESQLLSSFSVKGIEDVCLHAEVDFFDNAIMKFYPNPPTCRAEPKNITFIHAGKLKSYKPGEYDCWGRCVEFKSNKDNIEGPWFHTDKEHVFECDIVDVRCSNKNDSIEKPVYYYIHTQLVRAATPKPETAAKGRQYNVYFIVVDSQAYTQTFRNLNKTNEFLLKEMEAIHFPYMNRLSDRSRENAIPWWFGKFCDKIDRSSYNLPSMEPEPQWESKANCNRTLDNENFLLKEFAEYGYATNLAEDWWGTMDYECMGFNHTVSHHTYMPYVINYEKYAKLRNYLATKECLHRHQHLLDYFTQFVDAYQDMPKMGWMWIVHIGHNNEWGSKQADPHLLEFFKKNKKDFENSFVFLAGDHGMRFTGAVKTKVGMLDVNNPVMMMMIPKELRQNQELMETIRENSMELQTHFDTRATLLDILKYQPAVNYLDRSTMTIKGEFGNSFLRKQPKPRTCRTLPIPPQFCICQSPLNVDIVKTHPDRAARLGKSVADILNRRLQDAGIGSKCRPWSFNQTQIMTWLSKSPSHLQGVVFTETERKGFQGQFKVFLSGKDDNSMDILSLDRLDRYGDSGNCVQKSFRPICDCYS